MPSPDGNHPFIPTAALTEAFHRVVTTVLTSDAISDHAKQVAIETLNQVMVAAQSKDLAQAVIPAMTPAQGGQSES